MYETDLVKMSEVASSKTVWLESDPLGYLVSSMVAGMFITLGGFLAMSIGGMCSAFAGPAAKIASAMAFSVALSLVFMAGGELFTGNNLVAGVGLIRRQITVGDCLRIWILCWAGNFFGSAILVGLFMLSGVGDSQIVSDYFLSVASAKCSLCESQMFVRGVLCNILVCLAVWCAARMKSETAKLVMVFWCILAFMACGFEHSVANMGIIGVALANGGSEVVNWLSFAHNLLFVTFGNVVGGFAFVAFPYCVIGRSRRLL